MQTTIEQVISTKRVQKGNLAESLEEDGFWYSEPLSIELMPGSCLATYPDEDFAIFMGISGAEREGLLAPLGARPAGRPSAVQNGYAVLSNR